METQTINTFSEGADQVAAPEGHDEAMAKAFDDKQAEATTPETAPETDEKILGKFNSVDELVASYQELERKLSENSSQSTKTELDVKTEGEVDLSTEEGLVSQAVAQGVDVNSMAEYYDANGELSDEHYETLEKAGIPRSYVDSYIKGIEAQAEQTRQSILNEVGGEEEFASMIEWAKTGLTPEQIEAYNKAVNSYDEAQVKAAVMGLAFQYQRANGSEPKLATDTNTSGATNGFASVAQLTEAMNDPRYARDPAYRAEVEARLAQSNIF